MTPREQARADWDKPLPRAWSYVKPLRSVDRDGRPILIHYSSYSDYRAEWIMNGDWQVFDWMLRRMTL
jgi:hypothetical protein